MTRAMPTGTLGEREMIMGWLAFHRQTLEWKLEGVSADQAVARSTVSQLTLLGLVRHMTEVERGWIAEEYGGQELAPLYCRPGAPDADFDELDPAKYTQDMATWRAEIERTDRIVAAHSLDDTVPSANRGDLSMRWILWHVFEEYARHNGHADIIRESIDGAIGE